MRPRFPRLVAAALLVLVLALPAGMAFADTGYVHHAIGDPAVDSHAKTKPGLMLMGGGDWPDEAFTWFTEHAGRGHLVILRASLGAELQRKWQERFGPVASLQTFVFHDRRGADDATLLEAVRRADGIFIAGGDQSRYLRYWKGTPLAAALEKHVRDGKPLGGTSAGLAILGATVYGALDGRSITSAQALRDPLGPGLTLDHGFLRLPHLERILTDSHFAKRDRLGRLVAFLARAAHDEGRDDLVGLGIDEDTALCLEGDGRGRVFTRSGGLAWLVEPTHAPDRVLQGTPLTFTDLLVTGIGTGSRVDLASLRVESPAFTSRVDVRDGVLERHDDAAKPTHAKP